MSLSASTHFASDYSAAREKFLAAAAKVGAVVDSVQHPLRGPGGEKLFCDVAWLGSADADAVFVSMSATHGGEGYCGSGAQTAWFADGHATPVADKVAQVAIHAINPHGMAWMRRVTEDNVDLNRNFVDFAQPLPTNAGYERLHRAICPATWDEATRASTAAEVYVAEPEGPRELERRQAISGGQYTHPDGLFFGGHAPTWSHRLLRRIIETRLSRARRVGLLDYHTGLGPRGHGELIASLPPTDPGFPTMRQWFGDALKSSDEGTSVSPVLNGTNGKGVRRYLPAATELAMVALEYGTEPVRSVLDSLRGDNWLHWHGDPTGPEAAPIKAAIRACFGPEDDVWREDVRARAVEVSGWFVRGLGG
jgi:hypothetical protein